MTLWQILLLGLVQGAAELLPVSSSAHVIVAAKLMHLDPASPEMTFLIVMLHTGTMFAVICYFWNSWRANYFASMEAFLGTVRQVALATVATAVLGLGLKWVIEHVFLHGETKAEIEQLFSITPLIGGALITAGALIFFSGAYEEGSPAEGELTSGRALMIGIVQALCLPFRGFSRSGATISTGLLLGVHRRVIEEFSFALAVVLTPPLIVWELLRLLKSHPELSKSGEIVHLLTPGLIGMVFSFISGLGALWLLSSLLESGRWKYFGVYCFAFAAIVFGLAWLGY